MDSEQSKAPYLGGEEMKPAWETNPEKEELTSAEENEVAQMVAQGNMTPMEAKKIVLQKRQERDQKALNENISPEKAEEELNSQE